MCILENSRKKLKVTAFAGRMDFLETITNRLPLSLTAPRGLQVKRAPSPPTHQHLSCCPGASEGSPVETAQPAHDVLMNWEDQTEASPVFQGFDQAGKPRRHQSVRLA